MEKSKNNFYILLLSVVKTIEKLPNTVNVNLDDSKTNGLFTLDELNLFLRPYEILPIAQENKYLGKFFFLILSWKCMLCLLIRIALMRYF